MAVEARVPATFKIDKSTKRSVDLMASALGIDKSQVIDQAVKALADKRKREMNQFLDEVRESFRASDSDEAVRVTGLRKPTKYAGGPVK